MNANPMGFNFGLRKFQETHFLLNANLLSESLLF